MKVLAVTGGVGGAKLALGLAQILDSSELEFLVNTGDDFEHLGLHISPDVDTLLYTLGGLNNQDTGWGRAKETWNCLESIKQLDGETWFQLGDKDLAIHLIRTQLLQESMTLTDVIDHLRKCFGINHRIYPMCDSPVRTVVQTADGELPFQRYFVQQRCEPVVRGIRFEAALTAKPVSALRDTAFDAIIICPSNPYLSVDPILAVNGMREFLTSHDAPIVAVSPIVQGVALKGPTAKIMRELGLNSTTFQIAKHYRDLVDGLIIDNLDLNSRTQAESLGLHVMVTQTVMKSLDDRIDLAKSAIEFAHTLQNR